MGNARFDTAVRRCYNRYFNKERTPNFEPETLADFVRLGSASASGSAWVGYRLGLSLGRLSPRAQLGSAIASGSAWVGYRLGLN